MVRPREAAKIPSPPSRLSRETLIDTAVALADREGLAALTIRRLAAELGVTPMALYWHVRDKDELLAALRERMLAGIELPPPSEAMPWPDELRQMLEAGLRSLSRHPAIAPLALPGILDSEAGLVLSERVFGVLERAGFSERQTAQMGAYLLSSIVTLVTARPGADVPLVPEEQARYLEEKRALLAAIPAERFPVVARVARTMLSGDPEEYFDRCLELLVLGLQGLARKHNPTPKGITPSRRPQTQPL